METTFLRHLISGSIFCVETLKNNGYKHNWDVNEVTKELIDNSLNFRLYHQHDEIQFVTIITIIK
jgi:hypothetical protein